MLVGYHNIDCGTYWGRLWDILGHRLWDILGQTVGHTGTDCGTYWDTDCEYFVVNCQFMEKQTMIMMPRNELITHLQNKGL